MNAADILKYGNLTFLGGLDGVPQGQWETNGVCGWWSVKNIAAHLVSFELMLVDVLGQFLGEGSGETWLRFAQLGGQGFNDYEVEQRMHLSPAETLAEYKDAHQVVMSQIVQIPTESLRRPGTLPWYGLEYALDDFLVYTFYGHKREHTAQVNVFRDLLKSQGEV